MYIVFYIMNYILIAFLILLLIGVLYLLKEVFSLRDDISNINKNIDNTLNTNFTIIRQNNQNDLNVFSNRIKLLNEDLLQQYKKIIVLNNQPIKKITNHFTETDESEDHIKYISECNKITSSQSPNNLKVNENNTYSETSTGTSLDNFINRIANFDKDKNSDSYLQDKFNEMKKILQNEDAIQENSKEIWVLTEVNNNNNEDDTKKNNLMDYKNLEIESEDDEDDEDDEEDEGEGEGDEDENENEDEDEDEDEGDEDEEDEDEGEYEGDEDDEDEDEDEDGTEIEVELEQTKKIMNKKIGITDLININENDIDDALSSLAESEESESSNNIINDKITLGSNKKNKSDKKNEINISLDNNLININNLKNIESYTFDSLKHMAKTLSIPVTTKSGNKWKQLNKSEIYNEIKNYLSNKIKS